MRSGCKRLVTGNGSKHRRSCQTPLTCLVVAVVVVVVVVLVVVE
jgi:hypothetical protein